jgi:hypothetical protein
MQAKGFRFQGCGSWSLGCRVKGSGFRGSVGVLGAGRTLRVLGPQGSESKGGRFEVCGSGFGVYSSRCSYSCSEFRVQGFPGPGVKGLRGSLGFSQGATPLKGVWTPWWALLMRFSRALRLWFANSAAMCWPRYFVISPALPLSPLLLTHTSSPRT